MDRRKFLRLAAAAPVVAAVSHLPTPAPAPALPQFARGGIVPGSSGYVVGERGPEHIVPRPRLQPITYVDPDLYRVSVDHKAIADDVMRKARLTPDETADMKLIAGTWHVNVLLRRDGKFYTTNGGRDIARRVMEVVA